MNNEFWIYIRGTSGWRILIKEDGYKPDTGYVRRQIAIVYNLENAISICGLHNKYIESLRKNG
jgi:hypothetical protein